MIDQVRKYKLDPIPRGNLTGVVNRNLNRDDCENIEWTALPKATRMKPPPKAIAVIVDVIESQGAIHITDDDGSYIDMVGTEFAGHLVLVPWDKSWFLRGSGSIEVGYVIV
ncbi:uncharacterized protein N7518_006068 [Penicillium psychrosexuale]|uniref:uncharacterized protein n=1 Tax=Penicillium psychrosexuale TaxID=1002107 RepID=UPI0025450D06|nr:uncharacterized protein N7518_006068 [Penicillium psychrosexuale]KAJ5789057.1 hypothetical protein N7518_006068 [Penicillium psychrosexuale]